MSQVWTACSDRRIWMRRAASTSIPNIASWILLDLLVGERLQTGHEGRVGAQCVGGLVNRGLGVPAGPRWAERLPGRGDLRRSTRRRGTFPNTSAPLPRWESTWAMVHSLA